MSDIVLRNPAPRWEVFKSSQRGVWRCRRGLFEKCEIEHQSIVEAEKHACRLQRLLNAYGKAKEKVRGIRRLRRSARL